MGCWNPSHQANFRPFLSRQLNFWPLVNLAFSLQLASDVPKRLRMQQEAQLRGTSLNSLKLLSVSVSVSVTCSSDAPSLAEFTTVMRFSPTKVIL